MVSSDLHCVVLARRGRTQLNAGGRLRGHLDPELDEVGEAEAAALGQAIAEFLGARRPVRVLTSPLRRAVQTATAIATATGGPIELSNGLLDRDYGPWAGHTRASVVARFGNIDAADGIEPLEAVLERARATLVEQIPLLVNGPVVMVSHDAVNSALLSMIDPTLGEPDDIPQRTGCWNLLVLRNGTWSVDVVGRKPATTRTAPGRGDGSR